MSALPVENCTPPMTAMSPRAESRVGSAVFSRFRRSVRAALVAAAAAS
jgi:hypothetical protein